VKPNEQQAKTIIVAALAEMFNRELSHTGLLLYVQALDDLDVDTVQRAAGLAAKTCKFFPTPVELRELAGQARPEDRALLAWEAFATAVERVGGYASPDFDDPLINATVRALGGWQRVCELPTAEFDKWFRQDFVKTYTAFARAGVTGEVTSPLIGYFERTNRVLGYDRPQDRVTVRTRLPWAGKPAKRLGDDAPRALPPAARITLRRP